jgi:hypothetical protein
MRRLRESTMAVRAILLVPLVLGVWMASPSLAFGATWDGTNPVGTVCGNGAHPTYTLGTRVSDTGSQGIPTNIRNSSGTIIATVEIRHSQYCATVWAVVTNKTYGSLQVVEDIVTFTSANGGGRTDHWYPSTDTLPSHDSTGWSNQYRDRFAFAARAKVLYAGVWYYGETARAVAWDQYSNAFPNDASNYTCGSGYVCHRWPVKSPGVSATFTYGISPAVYSMPNGSGGTVDVSGDVIWIINQFTAVPAPNPYFNWTTYNYANYQFDAAALTHPAETTWSWDAQTNLYYWAKTTLNNGPGSNWSSSFSNRNAICHEFDHGLGLGHVWYQNSSGVDNVGSKATCIGSGLSAGPDTDDIAALKWVYGGTLP